MMGFGQRVLEANQSIAHNTAKVNYLEFLLETRFEADSDMGQLLTRAVEDGDASLLDDAEGVEDIYGCECCGTEMEPDELHDAQANEGYCAGCAAA